MSMPVSRKAGAAIGTLLCVAFLLALSSFHTAAQSQKNTPEFDRLTQKAWREGSVGVIVQLDVPGITELTAASARMPTVGASQVTARARDAADGILRSAITASTEAVVSELQGTAYTENRRYDSIPFVALRASAQAISALQASPHVLGIEEDVLTTLEPATSSSATPKAQADAPQLNNTVNIIGASTAWSWGFTGQGWYVAIVDTGIRKTHQFFTGKSVVEACFSLGGDGVGPAGDCPNGSTSMTGPGSAVHYPSSYEGFDHGTHVAGIATGNYGSLAGVAKNADIIAIQVFSKFSDGTVKSYESDQLAGLNYLYSIRGSYRVASANMSLGGGAYSTACDSKSQKAAIDNLRAAGIATAIATGNDGTCGTIGSPGCISSAIAVGSSTDSDGESDFNNWSATLQKLFAPGSQIYSSTGVSDTSYASWNGTSMATPHVAGAWALLKSVMATGSVNDFLAALRNTGVPITSVCDARRTPIPRIRVDLAIASLPRFTLTIQATPFGTTDPAPGAWGYAPGSQITVTAYPSTYADFVAWTGAASGSTNPLTVVVDANKTIVANFQYIFAPSATGQHLVNRSFSQMEYINDLKWQPSSSNAGLNVVMYRIYVQNGGTWSKLADVPATGSSLEYLHRKAPAGATQYAIAAITSNSREGAPAMITVQ